jgi:hypothetical protein
MTRKEKALKPQPHNTSDVSIADILRKGNLSVADPGPVTPPTAQVSLGEQPNSSGNTPSSNSSSSSETSK